MFSSVSADVTAARLTSRPDGAPREQLAAGLHTIAVPGTRDALLYVPQAAGTPEGVGMIVSLHGAGGAARRAMEMLRTRAEEYGFAILAPASRESTWDVIDGGYGPDVKALDHSLAYSFERLKVRREALAISGFSDGASYALCIGLANGDLFRHIVAFSPGFMSPPERREKPKVFVSHGTGDAILPIEQCGRAIVRKLRRENYEVEYREFEGPHTVPEDIKDEAMRWWLPGLKKSASNPTA
jgi:phospholipase/carboxylesterase